MASLAEIRARLAAQENNSQNNSPRTQSDNAIYPHWNISEGATATARFLPDGNPDNPYFWVERQIIKLPFNGVKGDSNVKQITVQVPCVEMYGENCPVLAEVRPWYKDETLKDLANKYWKKRSYLYQGFVRTNPLGDDQTPANPIRRFIISPQIQTVIKASLMDPELEELPTDYVRGLDFNIKKTSKGGYADYSTSAWSRKESALTEAEQAAVAAHGLFNLADFLPKKPSEAELRVIKEMFEASVDGRPYDVDKWGAYYRPYGVDAPAGSTSAPQNESAAPSTPAATTTETNSNDVPWEENNTATDAVVVPDQNASTDKAQDILAMIRAVRTRHNSLTGEGNPPLYDEEVYMTLPDERFRSLTQCRKLLEELCDPGKTPRVPSIIRDRARTILRHYPTDYDVEVLAANNPEILEKLSVNDKVFKQIVR